MRGRLVAGLLAAVSLTALAACSGTTPGDPAVPAPNVATDQTGTSRTTTSNPSSVPRIANPIHAPALADEPCQALSAEQVQKLGLSQGNAETDNSGPVCIWEYADVSVNQVVVGITTKFDHGLADVYKRRDALGYFKETTVAGYPGVVVGKHGPPDKGFCQMYVGLNHKLAPVVTAQLGGGTDYGRPCEVAKMTAENMIQNLEG